VYEKLIEEWAKLEGFQGFQVDHAAVLRNLGKWLDRRASIEQQDQADSSQVITLEHPHASMLFDL
jgi:hypothetical protein